VELPAAFVDAPSSLIGAVCLDLGVLEPLPRAQIKRSNDRQLKKAQASRGLRELQRLILCLVVRARATRQS
jgi:hypothetical protein